MGGEARPHHLSSHVRVLLVPRGARSLVLVLALCSSNIANISYVRLVAAPRGFQRRWCSRYPACPPPCFGCTLVETSLVAPVLPSHSQYVDKPDLFMYGMLCALLAGGIWLLLATYLELPVSTTHSIVGAIIGFSVVAAGACTAARPCPPPPNALAPTHLLPLVPHPGWDSVVWSKSKTSFPYLEGVSIIVISWFTSPILSAIAAVILFLFTRHAGETRRPFPRGWPATLWQILPNAAHDPPTPPPAPLGSSAPQELLQAVAVAAAPDGVLHLLDRLLLHHPEGAQAGPRGRPCTHATTLPGACALPCHRRALLLSRCRLARLAMPRTLGSPLASVRCGG